MSRSYNKEVFKSYTHADLDSFYGAEALDKAIQKADDPMLTGTSGMFNAIHGRTAFSQLNEQAQTWNVLPKVAWTKSGWRIRTARGVTLGSGGVADGSAIGDAVKSTIVEVSTTPKISDTIFAEGTVFSLLNGDDKYAFEAEMELKGLDHIKDINTQLLKDVDTLAGSNFESIDRICSNNSEATDATISLDAGDADIYGLDRDSVTTYDAYVDHNSASLRNVTIDMIRTGIRTIYQNSGKKPNVIITGSDQYTNIVNLFESNNRFGFMKDFSVSINGVSTEVGQGVGLTVATFDNIPMIEDNDVHTETSGGSRIYLLNTDTIFLGIARPTKLTMVDEESIGRAHQNKNFYTTIGELICTQFSANGKIRDLNA